MRRRLVAFAYLCSISWLVSACGSGDDGDDDNAAPTGGNTSKGASLGGASSGTTGGASGQGTGGAATGTGGSLGASGGNLGSGGSTGGKGAAMGGSGGMILGPGDAGDGGVSIDPPECDSQSPVDGEPCASSGVVCTSDTSTCACLAQGGDDPTWICFDGGGMGGFGNDGGANTGVGGFGDFGGFGNDGGANTGVGGFGNLGGFGNGGGANSAGLGNFGGFGNFGQGGDP